MADVANPGDTRRRSGLNELVALTAGWWRDAVLYEVYVRSFADGDGDGAGDLAGIRVRLPELAELGVDGVWLTPFYRSPMADHGYDVADHRDVDPLFGDLAAFDAFLAEAHRLGLAVLVDLVPNHSSDAHPAFQAALAATPGDLARRRYLIRPGRGPDGAAPPNNWISVFGGPAWTRLDQARRFPRSLDGRPDAPPDGGTGTAPAGQTGTTPGQTGTTPGQSGTAPEKAARAAPGEPGAALATPAAGGEPAEWYLHLFAPEQPDWDWSDPAVRADHEETLRFWLDRGVDGFRIDVSHGLVKNGELPDNPPGPRATPESGFREALEPHAWDQEGVHDVYRSWRALLDGYQQADGRERVLIGETWVEDPDRLARYVRPDELHLTFAFSLLTADWSARIWRRRIEEGLAAVTAVGAPATWVLANHDVARPATRYGGGAAGERRARAALLTVLALPGTVFLYQGDELALPQADVPPEARQDPVWERSGHTLAGRDGCRVPMPWSGTEPPYGFSAPGVRPWLPQPADWADLSVAAQRRRPLSTWEMVRDALAKRRAFRERADGVVRLDWPQVTDGELAFERQVHLADVRPAGSSAFGLLADAAHEELVDVLTGDGHPGRTDLGGPLRLRCVLATGDAVPIPPGERLLLASNGLEHDDVGGGLLLPPDTAAWFIRPADPQDS